MSNVQFEEQFLTPDRPPKQTLPTFNRFVIRLGLAKTKEQSDHVLVTIIILAFLMTIVVAYRSSTPKIVDISKKIPNYVSPADDLARFKAQTNK